MKNPEILKQISGDRLRHDLFYLCRDPLSFRTVMYTAPWHEKNSLDEADEFIADEMRKYSASVRLMPYKLQAFRCSKLKQPTVPRPEDPWYDANCIEVILPGTEKPEEIIQLVSHKDSMSWINSPAAHDNAAGTITNMELVRVLSKLHLRRTVRVLFCNEEHTPWYSKTYAEACAAAGDNVIAVLNNDCLCGKSNAEIAAGVRSFVSVYSTDEGRQLADFLVFENKKYQLPLIVTTAPKGKVDDDEGSFINAGYRRAVINEGSHPYSDPAYHLPGDIPERVDIANLVLSAQLILAAVLDLDEYGETVFDIRTDGSMGVNAGELKK